MVKEKQFITEKDIVFLTNDEIKTMLEEVEKENDDEYSVCVCYMLMKLKHQDVKND